MAVVCSFVQVSLCHVYHLGYSFNVLYKLLLWVLTVVCTDICTVLYCYDSGAFSEVGVWVRLNFPQPIREI